MRHMHDDRYRCQWYLAPVRARTQYLVPIRDCAFFSKLQRFYTSSSLRAVSLPSMGFNLAVVLSICCCLRPSLPATQECGSVRTDHPVSDYGSHKSNGVNLDPKPQNVNQGTRSPSGVLSEQAPNHQTTAPTMIDPEKVEGDNPPASSRAPAGANGLFNGASNFVLNQPVVNYNNEAKDKVLQWLAKYTMSSAEFDARGHVPGCHPGTRIKILELLQHQVGDPENVCRMVWVRGPAGVGKSAILQSLAERLSETSSLGATLFFSRLNNRRDPDSVIPTIAYQLAVRIPLYKEYIQQIMVNDPKLLEKDVKHQFQTLIVEPFTRLRLTAKGDRRVILLDGLDECQGEDAQVLVVKLINPFTRQHPRAPLVWVVASRPEAHLQVVFNSEEVRGSFNEHEVLANSPDACRDVEIFLRAKFEEIFQNYKESTPTDAPWPREDDITRVSSTSSGHFALAATIVYYVGDTEACNPISQLANVLSVTEYLEPGSLSTLYTLYSTILAGVPKLLLPTLRLVLVFYTTLGGASSEITEDDTEVDDYPLVLFATIFGLQQHAVYGALRKLHSVIKVPLLEESGRRGIKFYHASFPDYLKTLEVYAVDVDMMKKFWRGFFTVIHRGDSTLYRNATSGGQPPVPLSWDVKLAETILTTLWRSGIECIFHLPLPQCPDLDEGVPDHCHLSLNVKELQNVLENIDFSALIFRWGDMFSILNALLYLFKWLVSAAPAELLQSEVLQKISMRELNPACIPETKLSHKGEWYRKEDGTMSLRWIPFRGYTSTITPQHPHQDWKNKVIPIEELVSELDKLRSEDPMVDVLIIGRQPARRCALLCTQPTAEEQGSFYYVPYFQ